METSIGKFIVMLMVKDVVYGRIGHSEFKHHDLITDSPVYIDGILMNGGL